MIYYTLFTEKKQVGAASNGEPFGARQFFCRNVDMEREKER